MLPDLNKTMMMMKGGQITRCLTDSRSDFQ